MFGTLPPLGFTPLYLSTRIYYGIQSFMKLVTRWGLTQPI